MVKKVDAYRCEICKQDHDLEVNAGMCERSHLKPVDKESIQIRYSKRKKYPQEVTLKFHEGNEELIVAYEIIGVETTQSPIPEKE